MILKFWVVDILPSILFPLSYPPPSFQLSICLYYISSLPASSSLPIGQSPEQEHQGSSGFVPSQRPQVTASVETPSPLPLSPYSALMPSGPPPPPPTTAPPPHISQTAIDSPSDQDEGTESERNTCLGCCSLISSMSKWLDWIHPKCILSVMWAHGSPSW